MAGASQYLENARLNWLKGTTYLSAPANTYVALYTTAPSDDSGTGAVEVTGGSYARVAVASGGWSAISGAPTAAAQVSNTAAVTFPTSTASWGTVVAFGLYDALTSGNLLWWNNTTPQTIGSATTPSFPIGALVVSED